MCGEFSLHKKKPNSLIIYSEHQLWRVPSLSPLHTSVFCYRFSPLCGKENHSLFLSRSSRRPLPRDISKSLLPPSPACHSHSIAMLMQWGTNNVYRSRAQETSCVKSNQSLWAQVARKCARTIYYNCHSIFALFVHKNLSD